MNRSTLRRAVTRVAAVLGSLTLVAGLAGVLVARAASASSSLALGVYTGAGNTSGPAAFASLTGANITIASDYLDGSSWGAEVGTPGSPPWVLTQWQNTPYQLVIGIPMNPTGLSNSEALANGAAGDYDSYFTTLADNAQAEGLGNVIWRPGWEYDQGLVSTLTDAQNYAAYYRNIVTAMRAVNPNYQFTWDGTTDLYAAWSPPSNAYPGDAYVDYIALDFYDQTWTTSCGLAYDGSSFTEAEHECVWANDQSKALGILESFAQAHNKPVAFPEWGVIDRSDGHGGGDDPYWVNDFTAWMLNPANNVAWASYFDFNSGGDSVLSDFPQSLAAFQADLG